MSVRDSQSTIEIGSTVNSHTIEISQSNIEIGSTVDVHSIQCTQCVIEIGFRFPLRRRIILT